MECMTHGMQKTCSRERYKNITAIRDSMEGKLIVIDGSDGSGKQTQARMLAKRLEAEGNRVHLLSFPCYESFFGRLVSNYLHGAYGSIRSVHPEFSSMLFALDRYGQKERIRGGLMEGGTVILDRYVESNLAYQCAKIHDPARKKAFEKWLLEMEYGQLALPKPDIIFFLYLPLKISQHLIEKREQKPYPEGRKRDLHEADEQYLEQVRREYERLADEHRWVRIDCSGSGKILGREEIHSMILERLHASAK